MGIAQAIRLEFEPVRQIAAGAIQVAYMGIGTALEHPVRIIFIQNFTDASLWFSFNGIDDHFRLAAGGNIILDVTANKTSSSGYYVGENKRVYVRQDEIPSTGEVDLSICYGAVV